MMPTEGKRRG